ncbi:alpha/beta fold hydrolase [Neolewinella antarctica]|uniref:Pimeloyl-ACP methyl ester carboxylesterase n=1 Tax=Neolewinella antarctica TaxID=442734 RepID=A0ABX0X8C6_9BACT|nr:alpha/beta hydrolase [Neolewinella antarctica]NJC25500.1 pimeloyl-ACP methyl ester carboxylesterase [Neolewinella antarctica]
MSDTLHYHLEHAGPDRDWIVFIHGAGGSSVTWKHQTKAFQAHYNLMLLDLRDHGLSKDIQPAYGSYSFDIVTDDVLKALDHAGIAKAHFMSLSLGSIILQRLDARRPEMIISMIMVGGVFKADWRINTFAHSGKFLSYFVPFRWIYDGFIIIVMPRKNHAFSRKMYRRQSKKLAPGEFLKWLGLYQDFFSVVRAFYDRQLTRPALLVMGGQDHVFLDAAESYAKKHQPLAEIAVMEDRGHLCNLEDRKAFNKIVLSWLGELEI